MGRVKEGYWLTLTDKDGILLTKIGLGGFDLDKPFARVAIVEQVKDCLPSEAFIEQS